MKGTKILRAYHARNSIPEEKVVASLVERSTAAMLRRWILLKQRRRTQGLAAPLSRQLVFFILSTFRLDESFGVPAALSYPCAMHAKSFSSPFYSSAFHDPPSQRLPYLVDMVECSTDADIVNEMFFNTNPAADCSDDAPEVERQSGGRDRVPRKPLLHQWQVPPLGANLAKLTSGCSKLEASLVKL
jgi:hypothetical protein